MPKGAQLGGRARPPCAALDSWQQTRNPTIFTYTRMSLASVCRARLVALRGGGQAVRDAERGATLLQRLQRRHDRALRTAVERARRLVQQQDTRRLRGVSQCYLERASLGQP